jgi:demethylmenaquinone methyltransferase/2-methoxy-6-polyprenyl-1,4-benzoquinol methylase
VRYDSRTGPFEPYRRRIIDLLPVERGDVVLDVGCGTGLCFSSLQERIGPGGTIVGVDASREMLDLAAERAAAHGWHNVVLVEARVEEADLPPVDHALFCAVHDVLQSAPAVDNVLAALRPGGGVAAGGGKWAPLWAVPLNAGVLALHAPYVGDFTGFSRPWALLAERVPGLAVQEVAMGGGYLASGRVPGERA